MTKSWIPQKHDFTDFFKIPIKLKSNGEDNSVKFIEKLTNLSLLYDVPFSYLVPSESMLKIHEIRFFWLDSKWIRVLLDGACSIGRNNSIDEANDIEFLKHIYDESISQNVNIRRKLQGKSLLRGVNPKLPCTGFLLRSPLVGGWRGLEFKAYSDTEGQSILTPLRLETLSNEILLGLYSGEIKRLDIKEPPEGFHYGFNRNEDGTLTKTLRSVDKGEIIPDKTISLKERANRVINFSAAARDIKKELFSNSQEEPNSAYIALEMIQNPYMLKIKEE